MKQFLLFLFFFSASWLITAQSSLGDRLAVNLQDPGDKLSITIYPNPAVNHISLSDSEGVERILVFNMVGRQMKSFETVASVNQYFVGDLPRGMYLVQLLGRNNDIITTKRVSKR